MIQENKALCYSHVTYSFQSVSTLYSCLNVKGPLAISEVYVTETGLEPTTTYFVNKYSFVQPNRSVWASLAKWFGVRLQTKWLWVGVPLLPLKRKDKYSLSTRKLGSLIPNLFTVPFSRKQYSHLMLFPNISPDISVYLASFFYCNLFNCTFQQETAFSFGAFLKHFI